MLHRVVGCWLLLSEFTKIIRVVVLVIWHEGSNTFPHEVDQEMISSVGDLPWCSLCFGFLGALRVLAGWHKGVPLIPKRSFLKQMRKKIEGDSRFSWTCPLANCTSAQNHEQVHIYVQKLSQTGFDQWINYYAGVSLAGISCRRCLHRLLLQPWQRYWASSPIWTQRLC